MTEKAVPASHEMLLSHVTWVRNLARSLVHDPHLTEDLTQETCLAALQHPPPDDRSPRAWLKVVVRNFAHQSQRRRQRARRRECEAARRDEAPATHDLLEQVAIQRRVVDAVVELPEPYRSTILLRYFQDLPPRKIAAQLEVPVSTIKTRLNRGLQKLRAKLERDGNEKWLVALLPLVERSVVPKSIGALLMQTKLKAVVAVIVVLLAGALFWIVAIRRSDDAASGPGASSDSASALVQGAPGREASNSKPRRAADGPAPVVKRAEDQATPDASPAGAESPPEHRLVGRVFDTNADPLGGVEIAIRSHRAGEGEAAESTPPSVMSDGDGFFEMIAPPEGGVLVSQSSAYATVMAGTWLGAGSRMEPVVVVAPSVSLAGVVIDDRGAGLAGVEVAVELPKGFRGRFEDVLLDASEEQEWRFKTEEGGLFSLANAPHMEGTRVEAYLRGYERYRRAVPALSDLEMEIVLRALDPARDVLQGVVVDRLGLGVAGAKVAHGADTTTTNEFGAFLFHLSDPESINTRFQLGADTLVAVKEGLLPAFLKGEQGSGGELRWPEEIVLELGGEPLRIAGRVVGSRGEPRSGHYVWVTNPTFFGVIDETRRPTQVENILGGAESAYWHYVETDEQGRFEITGLLDRRYDLHCMDPQTLLRVAADSVRGGNESVEIRVPEDAFFERVSGRVVTRRGEPVESVNVFPMCDTFSPRYKEQTLGTRHTIVDGVTTDAEGHFEIERVPQDLVYLRVDGEDILPVEYGRRAPGGLKRLAGDRIRDLEIVVPLRCHVQVELSTPHEADEVGFLDADGNAVIANIMSGRGRFSDQRIPIEEMRTAVMAVTDGAVTLVLYKDEAEVKRLPVDLHAGEINKLRP